MGMNKYDRMLHILNLLRSRKNMNAETLAVECNVTERSIYRDIISLSEMNIPIYYDNGYKLASENFLPPLNFTHDEYQLLKLALESSPLVLSEINKTTYKNLKAKIESCFSNNLRKEFRYLPDTTHIDIPISDDIDKSEEIYSILEKAITDSRKVKIKYESIKSGQTERIVDPYFIIFKGRAFYFVGLCHRHEQTRTFRLNRIKQIELLDDIFIRPDDIDPKKYFQGSWSVFSGEPVNVVVIFQGNAKKVIESSNHHQDEVIEKLSDDSIKYKVTVNGLEEIQRWIIGFGGEAEVIEPDELRENLKFIGQFFTEKYK